MLLPLLVSACLAPMPAATAIDVRLASRYFQEAKWISDDDNGELWGKKLYGPMLLVDPQTRAVVANEEPPGMGLHPDGDVFVGTLPNDITIANTAIDYKGKGWSMVRWPLPQNHLERSRLVMHELWHRIQKDVGLPSAMVRNAHLDTMNGRIWLRLEVRALEEAMRATEDTRRPLEEDALTFRTYRQSQFPEAKRDEDRMEMHEGMAEYTGWMLRGSYQPETRLALAYLKLRLFNTSPSFPTSFAYSTGTAYGLLLNIEKEGWRKGIGPSSSLADLLAGAIGFRPAGDLKAGAEQRAQRYGIGEVFAEEREREDARLKRDAEYRRLLVDGPTLDLPLVKMNFSYDPGSVFPLGELGTVYPGTTIIDAWGKLTVDGAARITPDFQHAFVSAPRAAADRKGEGWTLELNPGWKLVAGKRKGDFVVVKG